MEGQSSDPASGRASQLMQGDGVNLIFHTSSTERLITDVNHNIIFRVNPCHTNHHQQVAVVDSNGTIIAQLKKKMGSLHGRWNAHRGESDNDSDLLFTMKKEHMYQSVTNLLVFLPNEQKPECVFKIRGSWSEGTLWISKGGSSIAQMKSMDAKDQFMVTINSDVDSLIVVSLFAIIQTMKNSPDKHHHDLCIGVLGYVIKAAATFAMCAVGQ